MAGLVESCIMTLKKAVGLLEGQDRVNNIEIHGNNTKIWVLKARQHAGRTVDTLYRKLSVMYKCVERDLKHYELILGDILDGNT